jgi:pimeloyl-ACP methyl ester carboxylesterase
VEQGPADGQAVLMLHGFGDSWFSYSAVLPLMPSTLRVIVPDQRGHGDSDRPADGYAIDDFTSDAIQLLDALGVKDAIVVGHSMGSLVAQRLAERAPSRVKQLVLLGTTSVLRNEATEALRRDVNALTDPVDPAFVRAFQTSMFHRPAPTAFVEGVIEGSMKLPAHVWKGVMNGLWNETPQYRSNGVTAIVIGGDKDTVFSVAEQRAVADAIPGATFVLLPDVGHGVHWEDPRVLASVFSDSNRPGR